MFVRKNTPAEVLFFVALLLSAQLLSRKLLPSSPMISPNPVIASAW